MGGPIVRTGTTPKFWENYEKIFGDEGDKPKGKKGTKKKTTKKKSAKKTTTSVKKKKATKKKATTKKVAKKKAIKKKTAKKKSKKWSWCLVVFEINRPLASLQKKSPRQKVIDICSHLR